jgi:hypothetical protein
MIWWIIGILVCWSFLGALLFKNNLKQIEKIEGNIKQVLCVLIHGPIIWFISLYITFIAFLSK